MERIELKLREIHVSTGLQLVFQVNKSTSQLMATNYVSTWTMCHLSLPKHRRCDQTPNAPLDTYQAWRCCVQIETKGPERARPAGPENRRVWIWRRRRGARSCSGLGGDPVAATPPATAFEFLSLPTGWRRTRRRPRPTRRWWSPFWYPALRSWLDSLRRGKTVLFCGICSIRTQNLAFVYYKP